MSGYTEVFGGSVVYPSDVSYLALALTANTTLQWPLEANTGPDIVARIIDVTPTGAYSITMPPASQTGTGQTILFNNLGASTITVLDNDGGTLLSATEGTVWQIYLTDNSTDAGSWRVFRYGAATASAQASALAGYGLVAQGSFLSQTANTTEFSTNFALGVADRASTFVWAGASGTLSLPAVATATNGYFVFIRNGGTGQLTVDPAGSETINGASTLVLQPSDSIIVVCSGSAWYTIGYGQDAVFAFDYTSISLTGEVDEYTLAGAELNRIAYSFTGVLTTDMEIIVPATTQQYWVSNDTTGSFNLSVRAVGQVTGVTVAQGARSILYCDGTNVVDATTGGLATPIAITDGGTGATTAGAALINLGGTSTGIGVFTAASPAAARLALGVAAPTYQVLLSGTGATYTTPAGCTEIEVTIVGAGGGTAGSGTSGGTSGSTGGASIFDVGGTAVTANGGAGSTGGLGALGGSAGSGTATYRIAGASGTPAISIFSVGGTAAVAYGGTGGGPGGGTSGSGAGVAGKANTGGGASGAATPSLSFSALGSASLSGGAGGGETAVLVISSPAASYLYTVGAGGTAGTAGTGGSAGGAGGSGYIIVKEFYG